MNSPIRSVKNMVKTEEIKRITGMNKRSFNGILNNLTLIEGKLNKAYNDQCQLNTLNDSNKTR